MKLHLSWAQGTFNLFLPEFWKCSPSGNPGNFLLGSPALLTGTLWLGRNFRTPNKTLESKRQPLWDLHAKAQGGVKDCFPQAHPWKSVGPPAIQGWEPETSPPALLGPNAEAAAASVRSGKSLYRALGLQNTTFLGFLLAGWTASCLWLSHTQHQSAPPPI